MDGTLEPGEMIEAKYARMLLRVQQKEDCLQISVYDSRSTQPDESVWDGRSRNLDDAKHSARLAARRYLIDHKMYLIAKGDKYTASLAAGGQLLELSPTLDWRKANVN